MKTLSGYPDAADGLLRCTHVPLPSVGKRSPAQCQLRRSILMSGPPEDDGLLDPTARLALIDRMFRGESAGLMRYFRRRGRCDADAQDLMQEAFLSFATARIGGDPLPYLRRIARNMLISAARRERRWSKVMSDAPFDEQIAAPTPPQQHLAIEARDVKRQIQEAIDRLPQKTRTIYLMHRVEGLSYVDIAQAMTLSVKSVEYHISSALKFLVRELDQR